MEEPKSENPLKPASIEEGSQENKQLTEFADRVKRNHKRVSTTRQVVAQLEAVIPDVREYIRIDRINGCSSYLAFNNYHRLGEIKLASANFCKIHQICSQCAQRRATKYAQQILTSIQNTKFNNLQLITLTVRNSHDLHEVLQRLFEYFKTLVNRYMRKNVKGSITNLMIGGVWTIEITWSEEKGWHPHIHGLIASTAPIHTGDVRAEWESISNGDSFICDSTAIKATETQDLWSAVMEVSKYTLKNQSLPPKQLFDVYMALKGKHLIRRFGTFTGKDIELNPNLTDYENEPFYHYVFQYMENHYRFLETQFDEYENKQDFINRRPEKNHDD